MKNIKGYEGKYSITENGKIFSHISNRYLIPNITRTGYHLIRLYKNNKQKAHTIHRLVAQTFLGESNLTVNHIDGDKSNNHVSNLEWITHSENVQHAYDNGLKIGRGVKGEAHSNSKLTNKQVLEIRYRKNTENISNVDLAKDYPVGARMIGAIINGTKWSWLS